MAGAGEASLDLLFGGAYVLSESSEAALEDYARAIAEAGDAEALRGRPLPAPETGRAGSVRSEVHGVRLLAPGTPLSPQMTRDVEDFARALAQDGRDDRLGWS